MIVNELNFFLTLRNLHTVNKKIKNIQIGPIHNHGYGNVYYILRKN